MPETPIQRKAQSGRDDTEFDPDERQASETFTTFQRNVQNLDDELQDLIASVTPLGASVAVLASSSRMRDHLAVTLSLVCTAAKQRHPNLFPLQPEDAKHGSRAIRTILPFNVALPVYTASNRLHIELYKFAKHIDIFFEYLREFTGYVDGSMTDAVSFICEDLKYLANCVEEAQRQSGNVFLGHEVFVHDITPDIGSLFVDLTKAISSVKHGSLVSLKFTHEHAVSNFTSMATIATFISAVIATVLALPHNPQSSLYDALASGCWLISLVLSISSAFHSVWAASWQQAVYRLPNPRVPPFVRSWMRHAPISLLLSSVVVFCAGIVFYTISSQPKWVIVAVAFVLGLCTMGFTVCAAWFIWELAAYFRYKDEDPNDTGSRFSPRLVPKSVPEHLPIEMTKSRTPITRTFSQESTVLKKFIHFFMFRKLWGSDSTRILPSVDHSRLAQAVKLVKLESVHFPVKTVGFNPDGGQLTILSLDGTAHIRNLPDLFEVIDFAKLRKVSGQLVWSTDGLTLAVPRGLKILLYSPDGAASPRMLSRRPRVSVDRPSHVKSVSWYPDSQAFLSIENTRAVKIMISNIGNESESYEVSGRVLHAAGVLQDGHIIFLGAATENRMPSTARAQNYIIVCDAQPQAELRVLVNVPVARKPIDLCLSRDRKLILVSYEGKIPPQLWHFQFDRQARTRRLTRQRTFFFTHDEPFAGPCALSGKSDEFVLGATRSGNIYIWDCSKGTLLRRIEAEKDSPGISCIAGSRSHDGCTFATGSLDGTVRFWQGLDPDPGSMRTDQTMTTPLPPVDQRSGLADVETMSPTLIAASGQQQPENDEGSVAGLGLSV